MKKGMRTEAIDRIGSKVFTDKRLHQMAVDSLFVKTSFADALQNTGRLKEKPRTRPCP